MQVNSNQSPSEPVPSTSKEPDKNVILSNRSPTNMLPHILPMPSDSSGRAIKYLQVSPLNTQNTKTVQLSPNVLSGLNIAKFPQLRMTGALQTTNIRIVRPAKSPPVAPKTIPASFVKILPKSPEEHIFKIPSLTSKVINTTNTNQLKKIPFILQKKAMLHFQNKSLLNSTTGTLSDMGFLNQEDYTYASPISTQPSLGHLLNDQSSSKQLSTYQSPTELSSIYESSTKESSNVPSKESLSHPPAKEEDSPAQRVDKDKGKDKGKDKSKDKGKEASKSSKKKDKSQKKKQKEKVDEDAKLCEESMYVADGFRQDVDILIEKCLQMSKLNFEKFSNVWKEMDFSCIFHERHSSAELAELSEEVIHIAKERMLAQNVKFEENVAGLFLVYGLLNLQPFTGFASLRLTPSDVPAVLALEAEARVQKRHDVLYVLGHVLIKGPCQFHVLNREVSLDLPIRKYYDGTVQMTNLNETLFTRNAECVPEFKNVMALDQRYEAARQTIQALHAREGLRPMSSYSKQPASQLHELYRAHLPRHRNDSPEEIINDILSTSKPEEDRSDLLKSIKERAMASTVDPMRHLTGVDERLQDSTSSSEESDIEEDKPKRSREKNHSRRKGRSTARTVQEIFGTIEKHEVFVPLPTHNEMPSLDALNDDTTDTKTNRTPKRTKTNEKSSPTKRKRKTKDDDSNNNSKPNKRRKKKDTDSPKVKRKDRKNAKNEVFGLLSEIDKVEEAKSSKIENIVDNNSPRTNAQNKDIKEKVLSPVKEPQNQEKCFDMPSFSDDIEVTTKDDKTLETVKNQKKAKSKKAKLPKNGTVINIVPENKSPKRTKKEIVATKTFKKDSNKKASKKPAKTKKESNPKQSQDTESAETFKSPTRSKKIEDFSSPKASSTDNVSSPKRSKKKAFKIEDFSSPKASSTNNVSSPKRSKKIEDFSSPKASSTDNVSSPKRSKKIEDFSSPKASSTDNVSSPTRSKKIEDFSSPKASSTDNVSSPKRSKKKAFKIEDFSSPKASSTNNVSSPKRSKKIEDFSSPKALSTDNVSSPKRSKKIEDFSSPKASSTDNVSSPKRSKKIEDFSSPKASSTENVSSQKRSKKIEDLSSPKASSTDNVSSPKRSKKIEDFTSPKASSTENVSSPKTPRTRESQRIKDQTPKNEIESESPTKKGLAAEQRKLDLKTFNKRVKSTFKKMGILEMNDREKAISK